MMKSHLSPALVLIITILFSACSNPAEKIDYPTESIFQAESTRRTTAMMVCTPPPCMEDEAYHCPKECPGGCDFVCATVTPPHGGEVTDIRIPAASNMQTFPDPTSYSWQPMVDGLENPLALTHAGDGSGRVFIIEQAGRVLVLDSSVILPKPFLDITHQVTDKGNEQGLLGLAFHPNYDQNGFFFVNYSGDGGDTIISRYKVSDDPTVADPETEKILMRIAQPYGNHNGGHLVFGPDGNFYIGTGDGGSAGDPKGNAQNLNSHLGKMLRINVDSGDPYAIPRDNPFSGGGGLPEIWASGLRNPWRYAFDQVTGDLYIADVGQNQWEEVNFLAVDSEGIVPAGANFGWDYWEGTHPYDGFPPDSILMIPPIWEYDHSYGCSITGGLVYRGSMPEWQGIYIYGDFCTGIVWGLLRDEAGVWKNQKLFQTSATITSFGDDEAGEIYLIDRRGIISRLVKSP